MAEKVNHTFVILSYKDSPYIEECILSLKKQTVASEILIATSTLTDSIKNIAKENKIDVITNPKSKGIGTDWSFAYDIGKTKYITLAHHDDIYLPQYTELYTEFAEKYKKNLFLFSDYYELKNGKLQKGGFNILIKRLVLSFFFLLKKNLKSTFFKKMMLSFGSPIPCQSVMYNKENIGLFSFSEEYSINLDWEAWLRLAKKKGDFVFVNKKLTGHRIYKGAETVSGMNDERRKNEDLKLFNQLWPKFIARFLLRIYSSSYKYYQ